MKDDGICISPVRSRRDRRDFVDVARRIYADQPQWVAPLDRSALQRLDRGANPVFEAASIEHFLARKAGRVVGRISATIYPLYVSRHGNRAFFGFFEADNDQAVADALFRAVEDWAEERGVRAVRGPFSYIPSQEVGLLVDGFDTRPHVLQPFNAHYYESLFAAAGYRRIATMGVYAATWESHQSMRERMIERGRAVIDQHRITVRSINFDRYEQEIETIRQLYNKVFAAHPEFTPLNRQIFNAQANEMRDFADPDFIRIFEFNGEPIAFAILLPDVNELLQPLRGKLTLGFLLRWRRRLAAVRSWTVLIVGADPAWAGRGVGRGILGEVARLLDGRRCTKIATTGMHDDNPSARALISAAKLQRERTYALFEKIR